MIRIRYLTTGLVALAMLAAACGNPSGESTDPPEAEVTVSVGGSAAPDPEAPDSEAPDSEAPDPLAQALERTMAAGSFGFEVEISLGVVGTTAGATLSGWVDGQDRELVLQAGDQQITTSVIDGVAMVQRPEGTIEIPLAEAGEAPSLELLGQVTGLTYVSPTRVTGVLSADAVTSLAISSEELSGDAEVTIDLSPDGYLAGYRLRDPQQRWEIVAVIFDVGGEFSGS
jgi:hypothetical protein